MQIIIMNYHDYDNSDDSDDSDDFYEESSIKKWGFFLARKVSS